MLEALFGFVVDVICYGVGRGLLLALSLGRYDACSRKANEGLVALLGAMVLLPSIVFTGAWLARA